jgi:cbb3-type cytochrome oxidase subunit 3
LCLSTLAIVLVAVGGVLLLLFLGGLLYTLAHERRTRARDARQIAEADRAFETARAADRGWDRDHLERVAQEALAAERPEFHYDSLAIVLVDDEPGVVEDRCHLVARSRDGDVRVVLCRDESGWQLERLA